MSERLFPTRSDAVTWSRHPDFDRLLNFLEEKGMSYSNVHEAIEKAAGRTGLDKMLSDEEYSLKSMHVNCLVNTLHLIKALAEDRVNIGEGGDKIIEKFEPKKVTYPDNLYLMYKDKTDGLNNELLVELTIEPKNTVTCQSGKNAVNRDRKFKSRFHH